MTHLLSYQNNEENKTVFILRHIVSSDYDQFSINNPQLINWESLQCIGEVTAFTTNGSECVFKRTIDGLIIMVTCVDSYSRLFMVNITIHNQFWKEYITTPPETLTHSLYCKKLPTDNKSFKMSFIIKGNPQEPLITFDSHKFKFPGDTRELLNKYIPVIGLDDLCGSKVVLVNEEHALIFVYISPDPTKSIKLTINHENLNGFLE